MNKIRTLEQLLNALSRGVRIQPHSVKPYLSDTLSELPDTHRKTDQHFCIQIAGHTVFIDSMYSDIRSLCENYITDLEPELQIQITEEELIQERMEAQRYQIMQRDGFLETLLIYRKISEEFLKYDIFLMHGAVIATNDCAYLFTAKSGVGKTTHIKKWLENLPDAIVVNGDKPLIRITEKGALACGTPWCGKEKMGTNIMVPLKAVILMERGEDNRIEEVSFDKAFSFLLLQTYWPDDVEKKKKTVELLTNLTSRVRFFRFNVNNLKDDAFSVAYNALKG